MDDFLTILEAQVIERPFVIGNEATIADLSISASVSFPADETGYEFAATHPGIHAWLRRIADLPGWRAPYELLPGKRLPRFA